MKITILDGTPEEVIKVVRALYPDTGSLVPTAQSGDPSPTPAPTPNESTTDGPESSEAPQKSVSIEFARRVLKRRPLSNKQLIALRTLQKAYPEWVTRDELLEATGYTAHQLAGLMGAFGRRMAHTEGYFKGAWFFDTRWNDSAGAYDYRLPDAVLEALRLDDLI